MNKDLEWAAKNVNERPDGAEWIGVFVDHDEPEDGEFKWFYEKKRHAECFEWEFLVEDWQAARRELGLDQPEWTEAEEEAFRDMEKKQAKPDNVNHPEHYQSDNGIECIDAIRAALGKEGFIAYCRGNVIKYEWRIKSNPAEDQGKAAWYANKAREALGE